MRSFSLIFLVALALGTCAASGGADGVGPTPDAAGHPASHPASHPPSHPASLVVTGSDGAELVRIDLSEEPTWYLAWNHSVTGILVRDFYAFRDGTMLLTHSHTPAYDAGLGHIPGRGRTESDGQGGYWIYELDEPVPGNAYLLRVGSERVAHTLVHGEQRVNLSAIAAGERVRIAVEVP